MSMRDYDVLRISVSLTLLFSVFSAVFAFQASAHLLDDEGQGPVDAFSYDEEAIPHLHGDCAALFECQPTGFEGQYFADCSYDVQSARCQCGRGAFSECNVTTRSSLSGAALTGGGGGLFGLVKRPLIPVFDWFFSLPFIVKALFAFVASFIVFERLRYYFGSSFARARSLHKKALKFHEKGNVGEAEALTEKANYHREKAYEEVKQGN